MFAAGCEKDIILIFILYINIKAELICLVYNRRYVGGKWWWVRGVCQGALLVYIDFSLFKEAVLACHIKTDHIIIIVT